MKILLSQIPDEGLHRVVDIRVTALPRVIEELGQQSGALTGELTLKLRGGNVEVKGAFKVELQVPCNRCLEPVPHGIDEPFSGTLAPNQVLVDTEEERHLSSGDLDVTFFDGESIDLTELLEDEIFLLLPETIGGEDEQGCCAHCGKDLEEMFKSEDDDKETHPFAKMKEFLR